MGKQDFKDKSMQAALNALRKSIARWTDKGDLPTTAIPALGFFKRAEPSSPITVMYEPSICISAQGAKRVLLGNDAFVYDVNHFLVTSAHLPTVVQVVQASQERPFLALRLQLDRRMISQLMAETDLPSPRLVRAGPGMVTGEVTLPLLTAFQRLIELLDEPKDIPVLAPILQREIHYRLLVSEQGERLRQMASVGSQGHRIMDAISWLKNNFAKPLHIDDLASRVHMSRSTFHHHFRVITAMSPLEYQKWLRLSEARRLMLTEGMDAATSSVEVGYESPSQFSREYRRQFGLPPLRDVTQLRQVEGFANPRLAQKKTLA
jgi:AraC-like DNA-binding protein